MTTYTVPELKDKTGDDLIKVFVTPQNCTSVSLSNHNLKNKIDNDLIKAFAGIHSNVHTLVLDLNRFGFVKDDGFTRVLSAIPATVRTLNLSSNNLGRLPKEKLRDAFSDSLAGVTFIDLSMNELENKSDDEKDFIFGKLSPGTKIKLSDDIFYNVGEHSPVLEERENTGLSGEDAVLFIKKQSARSSEYDLSNQGLGYVESTELADYLGAVSENVSYLDLSNNDLDEHTDEDLAISFARIPAGVKTINLRGNHLEDKSKEQQDIIFAKLPKSVKVEIRENIGLSGEEAVLFIQEQSARSSKYNLSNQGFGYIKGEELSEYLGAVSENVHHLDLSSNDLNKHRDKDLAVSFARIPSGINTINLRGNHLEDKTKKELDFIFSNLPKSVIYILLDNEKFYKPTVNVVFSKPTVDVVSSSAQKFVDDLPSVSNEDVVQLIAEESAKMKSYDLSGNLLGNLTGSEVSEYIGAVSDSVTSLDLSFNSLESLTLDELEMALRAIPPNVTSVDLSFNGFESKTSAEMDRIKAAIPKTVTNVNWDLEESLDEIIEYLSKNDDAVDLDIKNLGYRTDSELNKILSKISMGVNKLDLSANFLYQKASTNLATALRMIPSSIRTLDLSLNDLGVNVEADLSIVFAALQQVTSLVLIDNKLDKQSDSKLAEAFSKLPSSLTFLDLSGNRLEFKSDKEKNDILATIPPAVAIKLGEGLFFRNTDAGLVALLREEYELIDKSPAYDYGSEIESIQSEVKDNESILWPAEVLAEAKKQAEQDAAALDTNDHIAEQDTIISRRSTQDNINQLASNPPTPTKKRVSEDDLARIYADQAEVNLSSYSQVQPQSPVEKGISVDTAASDADDEACDSSISDCSSENGLELISEKEKAVPVDVVEEPLNPQPIKSDQVPLDLSSHSLGYESLSDDLFSQISPETNMLILKDNYLGNKDIYVDDLVYFLQNIPKNITHLDLSLNGFEDKKDDQLAKLFQAIPDTVTHVKFDKNVGFVEFRKSDSESLEDDDTGYMPPHGRLVEALSDNSATSNFSFYFDCLVELACDAAFSLLVLLLLPVIIPIDAIIQVGYAAHGFFSGNFTRNSPANQTGPVNSDNSPSETDPLLP